MIRATRGVVFTSLGRIVFASRAERKLKLTEAIIEGSSRQFNKTPLARACCERTACRKGQEVNYRQWSSSAYSNYNDRSWVNRRILGRFQSDRSHGRPFASSHLSK